MNDPKKEYRHIIAKDIMQENHPLHEVAKRWAKVDNLSKRKARAFLSAHKQYQGVQVEVTSA